MDFFILLIFCLMGYLLGSLCFAVWVSKHYFSIDIRTKGSGNPGASNTFRILGKRAGIAVLILDILKGVAASLLPLVICRELESMQHIYLYQILAGFFAVVGHIFPVFSKFNGGKGIATLLGVMIVIEPEIALFSLVIFTIIFFMTGYISLASIAGTFVFSVILILLHTGPISFAFLFPLTPFILVLLTHQKNIQRLIDGTESRFQPLKKI
jgi:acyl phosphate:glycerol-3-phosphate acyltransferase